MALLATPEWRHIFSLLRETMCRLCKWPTCRCDTYLQSAAGCLTLPYVSSTRCNSSFSRLNAFRMSMLINVQSLTLNQYLSCFCSNIHHCLDCINCGPAFSIAEWFSDRLFRLEYDFQVFAESIPLPLPLSCPTSLVLQGKILFSRFSHLEQSYSPSDLRI